MRGPEVIWGYFAIEATQVHMGLDNNFFKAFASFGQVISGNDSLQTLFVSYTV